MTDSAEDDSAIPHEKQPEGTIVKWWNGEWQYRLRVTEVNDRDLWLTKLERRGPGGSWSHCRSKYHPNHPGVARDGDIDE